MPRNSSGTYTLPSGNPVSSGTLIEASWANTTLSDLASAMTNSLSRGGEGGMTAALRLFDGTVSLPGLAFTNETSTGLYRAGSGDMRLAVTGSQVVQFLTTGVAVTGTLSASGNFAINTDKFTVAAASGNTVVAGTLAVTGNVAVNTDKFTVAASSGNTAVAGTLAVTGASTFTGAATFNATTTTFTNSTAYYPQIINRNTTNDANASYVVLDKIRGSSIIQNGDVLGNVIFRGYDGTQYLQGAYINALVSAAPGTNDMPTDLVFGTTADGGAGPTERVRITQAGNVGIGTSSPSTKLHLYGSTDQRIRFENTGWTKAYQIGNDQNALSFYDVTASTERMRIDSSGNVGIGTSSPSYKLDVLGSTGSFATTRVWNAGPGASDGAQILLGNSANYTNAYFRLNGGGNSSQAGAGSLNIGVTEVAPIAFYTTNTERMRIDSSGNLLVGTTSAGIANALSTTIETSGANNSRITVNHSSVAGSSNDSNFMQFGYGGNLIGRIVQASTTTVSYTTSSDYRLKENVQPMVGALEKISALKPVTYTWKSSGESSQGFIAHELQAVVPECVSGQKDAVETYTDEEGSEQTRPVYQGIDTSFLVATLTAAIQEQQTLITQLTTRLEALESAP